jgi:hypothetical protein
MKSRALTAAAIWSKPMLAGRARPRPSRRDHADAGATEGRCRARHQEHPASPGACSRSALLGRDEDQRDGRRGDLRGLPALASPTEPSERAYGGRCPTGRPRSSAFRYRNDISSTTGSSVTSRHDARPEARPVRPGRLPDRHRKVHVRAACPDPGRRNPRGAPRNGHRQPGFSGGRRGDPDGASFDPIGWTSVEGAVGILSRRSIVSCPRDPASGWRRDDARAAFLRRDGNRDESGCGRRRHPLLPY